MKARIDRGPVKCRLNANGKINWNGNEGMVNKATLSLDTPASMSFRVATPLIGANPIWNESSKIHKLRNVDERAVRIR